jgi:hypothetical protein
MLERDIVQKGRFPKVSSQRSCEYVIPYHTCIFPQWLLRPVLRIRNDFFSDPDPDPTFNDVSAPTPAPDPGPVFGSFTRESCAINSPYDDVYICLEYKLIFL